MNESTINTALSRCNKPATTFSSSNGYRCCKDHAYSIKTDYFEHRSVLSCDYPLDNLGDMSWPQRQQRYAELFLDYFNNFMTSRGFAEHYNLPHNVANAIIDIGREVHEREVITDYERRVRALEAGGCTRSDAQAVVDAENMQRD